jgi:hypothetical protein
MWREALLPTQDGVGCAVTEKTCLLGRNRLDKVRVVGRIMTMRRVLFAFLGFLAFLAPLAALARPVVSP